MKFSKSKLIAWSIGLLMPLWLLVADLLLQRFTGTPLPGAWLYVGMIVAAVLCAVVISFSCFPIWQRIALVFASWLLLAGEVLIIGVFELARSGVKGIQ